MDLLDSYEEHNEGAAEFDWRRRGRPGRFYRAFYFNEIRIPLLKLQKKFTCNVSPVTKL
jgi:hypothetical protein